MLTEAQVGAAFRRLREIRGLTQMQVAAKAHTHKNTIIRLEAGAVPSFRIQLSIAEAMDMPLSRVIRAAEQLPVQGLV